MSHPLCFLRGKLLKDKQHKALEDQRSLSTVNTQPNQTRCIRAAYRLRCLTPRESLHLAFAAVPPAPKTVSLLTLHAEITGDGLRQNTLTNLG